jgi:hypothetical protein
MGGSELFGGFERVLLIVAGGALSVAVIAMLVSCVYNCRFLRSFRQAQRRRFNDLRIRRMLESLGVNKRRYMRKALIAEVETHLNRCQQCPNTPECDAALANGDISDGDAFCPNFRELVKFSPRRGTARGGN